MKIGICAWSFTDCHHRLAGGFDPFAPEDLARLAADHGLASIECAPGPFQTHSAEQRARLEAQLSAHRLGLVLDTGGHDYALDITPLTTALEVAAATGVRVVRTTISGVLEGDRRRYGLHGWRGRLQALVEPLRRAMDTAERLGISVGLENHQDATSWELLWLGEQVGSELLGVTMDVANALAVGETPAAFAMRVMPRLKHVHLKDYTVHPTPSGYRLKRCALGEGVVDWPAMLKLFDDFAPQVEGCIELGAATARHIRVFETDYWATYPPRPLAEVINAMRALHQAARPPAEEWRTPHEQGLGDDLRAAYEMDQFERSVRYLNTVR